jgi:hypothetical protein
VPKTEVNTMIGGVVISILVFAVGAIFDFAVTASTNQHGFDIQTVGAILMIVGAVGFVVSLIALAMVGNGGFRRRRTIVDDGRGHVTRREDTYI